MIAACGAIVFAVFVLLSLRNTGLTPFVFADEWEYSSQSRLMALQNVELPSYLYFLIMRITNRCGPSFLDCARLINTLCYCSALPLIYGVSRRWNSRALSLLIATLAILTASNWYTALFMPESMYFLGFWVFAFFMLRNNTLLATRYGLGVGLIIGALALVKAHGVFLIPSAVAYFVMCEWFSGRRLDLLRIAKYVGALVLGFVVARYVIGYAIAGKPALSLFGKTYTTQTSGFFSVANAISTGKDFVAVFIGHILALCVLFSVPIYTLSQISLRRSIEDVAVRDHRELLLFTGLILVPLLIITAYFTASIVVSDTRQSLTHLHVRYYFFCLPLLLIVAGTTLAPRTDRHATPRLFAGVLIALIAIYGGVRHFRHFHPDMTGSPDIFGLMTTPWLLSSITLLSAACVIALAIGYRSAARIYLYIVVPVATIFACVQVSQVMDAHHTPGRYDEAGRLTKTLLGKEVDHLAIIGPEIFALYQTRFNVDSNDVAVVQNPIDQPIPAAAIAGRDWLLLLDGTEPPTPPAFSLPIANNVRLVNLENPLNVDMRREQSFGHGLAGFSQAEWFGRWTIGHEASITFDRALPKHFFLTITALAFANNCNDAIVVQVGDQTRELRFNDQLSTQRVEFISDGNREMITFLIPHPLSPASLGPSPDNRLLGIGISTVLVEE